MVKHWNELHRQAVESPSLAAPSQCHCLVVRVVFSHRLDLMTSEVLSNLVGSVILGNLNNPALLPSVPAVQGDPEKGGGQKREHLAFGLEPQPLPNNFSALLLKGQQLKLCRGYKTALIQQG